MSQKEEHFMKELAALKREQARTQINDYFTNVIEPLLPNCKYAQATDELFEGVHLGFGSKVRLKPYNYILKDSPYYYKKPLQFIHYTSLNNCLNILREKSFRMYNLNGLDDKYELLYASNMVFPRLSEAEIRFWKSNVFTLSMCEYTLEKKEKSFDTWRNYAQDGLGVGIVLRYEKDNQLEWMNRHLSKIYYDDKLLLRHAKRHESHIVKTGYPIVGDHQELLLNLGCFHKLNIYKNEMEVRYIEIENGFDKKEANDARLNLNFIDEDKIPIIFVNRIKDAWENHKAKSDNSIRFDLESEIDLGKDKKTARFRRLHLDADFRNDLVEKTVDCAHVKKYVNSVIPSIKIEKIILGYRFDESAVAEIRKVINEVTLKTLGYPVEVELTRLKKYF